MNSVSMRKVSVPGVGGVPSDFRFGSLADIRARTGHVRFTPNSGHVQGRHQCPLSAISRHSHRRVYPSRCQPPQSLSRQGFLRRGRGHQEPTIVLSVRCSRHLQRVGDQSRSLRQGYRAKERRRRLLGPTKSPNRLLFQDVFHGVWFLSHHACNYGRFDGPGANRVDANASRGVFERSTLRQSEYSVFGCMIRCSAGASFLIGRLHAPARKI